MIKCDHITINELARIGDRVFFNADETDDSWHYMKAEERALQGKTGYIFGFQPYTTHEPHFGFFLEPGTYLGLGACIVRWDDGTGGTYSLHHLSFWPWGQETSVDPLHVQLETIVAHNKKLHDERQALRKSIDFKEEKRQQMIRLGGLPDLPIWQHDFVLDKDGTTLLKVASIQWNYWGQRRDDGSWMPLLTLEHPEQGWQMSRGLGEVTLFSRGNVWKWYNDDKKGLIFKDIQEEAAFYTGMGRSVQVRNDEGVYSFTQESALRFVQEGRADSIGLTPGLFNTTRRPYVVKFLDEEVGRRMRKATLDGFNVVDLSKSELGDEEPEFDIEARPTVAEVNGLLKGQAPVVRRVRRPGALPAGEVRYPRRGELRGPGHEDYAPGGADHDPNHPEDDPDHPDHGYTTAR